MPSNQNNNYCLNCNRAFPIENIKKTEVHCSYCGQSSKAAHLSIIKLIGDGFSNIFNLESRFLHTIKDIIYPSKLTRAFVEGKRKYYVNPARLFAFVVIATITISLWLAEIDNVSFGGDLIQSRAEKSLLLEKYEDLIDSLEMENLSPISDTIKKRLFKNVYKPENDTIGRNQNLTVFGAQKNMEEYGISAYDAVHLPMDEVFEKYKITEFWDRQYVSTFIRTTTDPANSLIYVIKNITWAVFITIILISLFMKLIYIRGHYYIIEHTVLQLNLHSFYFVIIAFLIILFNASDYFNLNLVEEEKALIYIVLIFFMFSVQFLAIKKYYNHGIFKALLSQSLINFAYSIIFFMSVLFVALISVFLY